VHFLACLLCPQSCCCCLPACLPACTIRLTYLPGDSSLFRLAPSVCVVCACLPAAKGEGEGGAGEASWGEVLSSRPAIVGMMLFVFQQFSGINAIVYFSSSGARAGCLSASKQSAVQVLMTSTTARTLSCCLGVNHVRTTPDLQPTVSSPCSITFFTTSLRRPCTRAFVCRCCPHAVQLLPSCQS
jgi:hypothetical protein